MTYSLMITTTAGSATLRVAGDLDYETADDFVEVASQLIAHNALSDLHLDFAATTFLDSTALSGLLLVHRRSAEADVTLHLDHRPAFLDRVLQVTGLLDHFDLTTADAAERDLLGRNESRAR